MTAAHQRMCTLAAPTQARAAHQGEPDVRWLPGDEEEPTTDPHDTDSEDPGDDDMYDDGHMSESGADAHGHLLPHEPACTPPADHTRSASVMNRFIGRHLGRQVTTNSTTAWKEPVANSATPTTSPPTIQRLAPTTTVFSPCGTTSTSQCTFVCKGLKRQSRFDGARHHPVVCKNQSSLACEHCRKYVCHVHQAKHVCAEYKKLVADHVASHSHTLPKCSAIDCEQVSQVKCVHCLQNFCTAHRQPHYCVWEHCKFPGCRSSSSITLSTPCRYCDDFYCDSHVKVHEVTCPKRPPISPPCSQGSLLDDGTDSDSEDQLEGRGGPMPETPRGGAQRRP